MFECCFNFFSVHDNLMVNRVDMERQPVSSGTFGQVCVVEDMETHELLVQKKIMKPQTAVEKARTPDWRIEAELQMKVNSPYVVPVKAIYEDEHFGYILMEYCSKGTLENYLYEIKETKHVVPESVSDFIF
jgi:serine/threonine protein kinase